MTTPEAKGPDGGRAPGDAARAGAEAGDAAAAGRAPVGVRPVRSEDLGYVWEMIRGLAEYEQLTDILTGTRERLRELLYGDPPALFGRVAERPDGRLVGYALYHFTYSSFRTNQRMWLEDLFVEESARGTGAGDGLLRAFVADSLERGCHRVDWGRVPVETVRGLALGRRRAAA